MKTQVKSRALYMRQWRADQRAGLPKRGHFKLDITNQRFGRLVAIEQTKKRKLRNFIWKCQCDCGKIVFVPTGGLRNGNTKSCGCIRVDLLRARSTTHGMKPRGKYNSEYEAFNQAKMRCRNPNNKNYKDYGGRGIEFRFSNYQEFYDAIGPKPTAKHTLDREDNSGHYEAGNIKWSTMKEQCANRRHRKY